jgi:tetratricopeptide (TPR) repeat protein
MGKWQTILDRPAPADSFVYAAVLDKFARGLAHVRRGDVRVANACLDAMRRMIKDPVLAEPVHEGNPPIVGATIAAGILEGEVLFAQGKLNASMAAFDRAIQMEDGMAYLEPKDWVLPVRHFAGVCLLKEGKAVEAEKMYQEDLVHNPGSGWALLGLAQSLEARHQKGAAEYRARAVAAFAGAEEVPPGSVY